jgi:NitT/TauT family transport system ATP-binding protein
VFITHSVDEAITLGDRIAVITSRPGRVKEILPVHIPKPRGRDIRQLDEYIELRDRIWSLLAVDSSKVAHQQDIGAGA